MTRFTLLGAVHRLPSIGSREGFRTESCPAQELPHAKCGMATHACDVSALLGKTVAQQQVCYVFNVCILSDDVTRVFLRTKQG